MNPKERILKRNLKKVMEHKPSSVDVHRTLSWVSVFSNGTRHFEGRNYFIIYAFIYLLLLNNFINAVNVYTYLSFFASGMNRLKVLLLRLRLQNAVGFSACCVVCNWFGMHHISNNLNHANNIFVFFFLLGLWKSWFFKMSKAPNSQSRSRSRSRTRSRSYSRSRSSSRSRSRSRKHRYR